MMIQYSYEPTMTILITHQCIPAAAGKCLLLLKVTTKKRVVSKRRQAREW